MEPFYWTGYCSKNRNQAISEIENIISKHGFITDFKKFSDISISLVIEITERKIDSLYNELFEYMTLKDFDMLSSESENERTILINITFTKGTGDFKIEVPALPG